MNGSTALISLIVILIVTTGGVLVAYDLSSNYRAAAKATRSQQKTDGTTSASQDLHIVSVVGTNVQDDGVKYVQIQVRNDGGQVYDLNDTLIELRTDKSVSDLQYRNGTTNRSVVDGFYTQ
jgi:archaellin